MAVGFQYNILARVTVGRTHSRSNALATSTLCLELVIGILNANRQVHQFKPPTNES